MNSPDKACTQKHELDLPTIFDNFKSRMVEIEFSRRELKNIHESALKDALNTAENLRTASDQSSDIYNSFHAMFFSHPETGQLAPYGVKEQTPSEKIINIQLQLNKLHCWLLAEAYEEFEDFLEQIYAHVGYLNPEIWPMSDFGGISIRDIKSKTPEWFLNQSRTKKSGSRGIVNQLNKEFPEIKEQCEKNEHLGNIGFQLTVIEKMRHLIVHNRGQVTDREKFTESIFKDVGISINDENAESYKNLVNYHIGTNKRSGEDIIYLLDRPIKELQPFNAKSPVFERLVGLLLAFASIAYKSINDNLGAISTDKSK